MYDYYKIVNIKLIFRVKACERRRTELYAKQGRKNQFRTAEERDRWITEVSCSKYIFCASFITFIAN